MEQVKKKLFFTVSLLKVDKVYPFFSIFILEQQKTDSFGSVLFWNRIKRTHFFLISLWNRKKHTHLKLFHFGITENNHIFFCFILVPDNVGTFHFNLRILCEFVAIGEFTTNFLNKIDKRNKRMVLGYFNLDRKQIIIEKSIVNHKSYPFVYGNQSENQRLFLTTMKVLAEHFNVANINVEYRLSDLGIITYGDNIPKHWTKFL